MRKGSERGAVVVEGIISLTTFMFTIFTILSIVNICFIQSRMSVALNSAAKEISQYSYFYYKFGLDQLNQKISSGTADSRQLADKTVNGVAETLDMLAGAGKDLQNGAFDEMADKIEGGVNNMDSLYTQYADRIKQDPKGFILGMGKMMVNELTEEGKTLLCQVLAKTFMSKNLVAYDSDTADAFLRRYQIEDGMDGLDFDYTTFLQNGTSNLIQLVVTYDVKVIQLLNIDFTFTFRQCSKVTAWGRGISKINPGSSTPTPSVDTQPVSVWNSDPGNGVKRGDYIINNEKEQYTYTDTSNGFNAYDNTNGKNEFITIVSVDTTNKTYQTADQIRYKLNQEYSEGKLDYSGEMVTTDGAGNKVTIESDPETRTRKIIMVVPDNADMAIINQGVADFTELNPDVTVEVKTGYGDSNKNDAKQSSGTSEG